MPRSPWPALGCNLRTFYPSSSTFYGHHTPSEHVIWESLLSLSRILPGSLPEPEFAHLKMGLGIVPCLPLMVLASRGLCKCGWWMRKIFPILWKVHTFRVLSDWQLHIHIPSPNTLLPILEHSKLIGDERQPLKWLPWSLPPDTPVLIQSSPWVCWTF